MATAEIIAQGSPDGHLRTELSSALTTSTSAEPQAEETQLEKSSTLSNTESTDVTKKTKRIIRRKRRPAKPQVDSATFTSEPPPQTGTIFNIWYNKWSGGDREDRYLSQTHAKGRCNVALDTGYTRADRVPGSFFCLFFARGLCPRGHECEYLHRIPTIHDHYNSNVDCFGRTKFSDYRDDMGGVGSFMRQNRTLYIGRIHVTDDIEEVVARHFTEWGEVERTRVLTGRGIAFVTYSTEHGAEFAKEAMAHQSLDHEEILNVRWATQDPNPLAQKREARRLEEQAAEAVRRALPAEYVAEIEGRDSEAVKRRRVEGTFGLEGYQAPEEVLHARAKALHAAEQQDSDQGSQLEAPPETALLEAPPEADSITATNGGDNGILSGRTLASLKGRTFNVGGAPNTTVASKGLVSYGSDDESDSDA